MEYKLELQKVTIYLELAEYLMKKYDVYENLPAALVLAEIISRAVFSLVQACLYYYDYGLAYSHDERKSVIKRIDKSLGELYEEALKLHGEAYGLYITIEDITELYEKLKKEFEKWKRKFGI